MFLHSGLIEYVVQGLTLEQMPYYHIYNRGAHKAPIFNDKSDYQRFVCLLYIANDSKPLVFKLNKSDIFSIDRQQNLVDIFSYCLMPNHFHLGLMVETDQQVEQFVRKLCTAYVMYFNKKYNHSGTIFQGKYKAKTIDTDQYLARIIEYIHLNPFGIEEPDMLREVRYEHYDRAVEYSKVYEFSSFKDYLGEKRPQNNILSKVGPWTIYSPASPQPHYI